MTAEARRRGSGLALTEASFLQALIQHHLGRVDEARSAAEYAVSGTDGGWGATVPAPHGFLVDCLLELGELDAAERLLDSGEMEPNRPEASGLNAWFHWARGRTRMVRRNPSAALEDFLAAGRDLEPFAILNPAVLAWRSQAALAAHMAGDHDHAQALIDQELALARACNRPGAIGVALRARALSLDGAAAADAIEEAIDQLRQSNRALELAGALLQHGRAIRLDGHPTAARDVLREALDLADRCRATRLAQNARDELLAAGARPRRSAIAGRDALTPSEQRVAEHAAQGQTNREIAETLFLTRNTVETHLRHVFRKLSISSRDQLPDLLDRG